LERLPRNPSPAFEEIVAELLWAKWRAM
jgi:hypothetical protein